MPLDPEMPPRRMELILQSVGAECLIVDDKGEYALLCIVDVNCIRSYDGYDTTISERILLLVQQRSMA